MYKKFLLKILVTCAGVIFYYLLSIACNRVGPLIDKVVDSTTRSSMQSKLDKNPQIKNYVWDSFKFEVLSNDNKKVRIKLLKSSVNVTYKMAVSRYNPPYYFYYRTNEPIFSKWTPAKYQLVSISDVKNLSLNESKSLKTDENGIINIYPKLALSGYVQSVNEIDFLNDSFKKNIHYSKSNIAGSFKLKKTYSNEFPKYDSKNEKTVNKFNIENVELDLTIKFELYSEENIIDKVINHLYRKYIRDITISVFDIDSHTPISGSNLNVSIHGFPPSTSTIVQEAFTSKIEYAKSKFPVWEREGSKNTYNSRVNFKLYVPLDYQIKVTHPAYNYVDKQFHIGRYMNNINVYISRLGQKVRVKIIDK